MCAPLQTQKCVASVSLVEELAAVAKVRATIDICELKDEVVGESCCRVRRPPTNKATRRQCSVVDEYLKRAFRDRRETPLGFVAVD